MLTEFIIPFCFQGETEDASLAPAEVDGEFQFEAKQDMPVDGFKLWNSLQTLDAHWRRMTELIVRFVKTVDVHLQIVLRCSRASA